MINVEELNNFFVSQPEMVLLEANQEKYTIEGIYNLTSIYDNIYLYDSYSIRIEIKTSYPKEMPQVFSLDKKIPKGFDHIYPDGSFCLGSPMELHLSALKNRISDFLTKHIDSYLYSVSYFKKYNGEFPYGDRSHGSIGIFEFWKEYLNLDDVELIYNILKFVSEDNYRGHNLCPCGSQKKLRNCHGDIILPIFKNSLTNIVRYELDLLYNEIRVNNEYKRKEV